MNMKKVTALLLTAVLFICLLPANAAAARLRKMDNEDYTETYTFYPNVANLPAAFARHSPDNFNLYYIAGSCDTAVYCIQIDSPQIFFLHCCVIFHAGNQRGSIRPPLLHSLHIPRLTVF